VQAVLRRQGMRACSSVACLVARNRRGRETINVGSYEARKPPWNNDSSPLTASSTGRANDQTGRSAKSGWRLFFGLRISRKRICDRAPLNRWRGRFCRITGGLGRAPCGPDDERFFSIFICFSKPRGWGRVKIGALRPRCREAGWCSRKPCDETNCGLKQFRTMTGLIWLDA